jgi:hypothetical protein
MVSTAAGNNDILVMTEGTRQSYAMLGMTMPCIKEANESVQSYAMLGLLPQAGRSAATTISEQSQEGLVRLAQAITILYSAVARNITGDDSMDITPNRYAMLSMAENTLRQQAPGTVVPMQCW